MDPREGAKTAVVLLSGGLDSSTTLALACHDFPRVYALSVDYGQRNRFELAAAARIAKHYKVAAHRCLSLDLGVFGGSSLTGDGAVERDRNLADIGSGIPSTYVPARNTVLLALALAWADAIPAEHIFIGVNALDSSGYPDCRPEFIAAFQTLSQLATRSGVENRSIRIHAPLIELDKRQIVTLGNSLKVPYQLTMTCYDPTLDGAACGVCDACKLRLRGFALAGIADPVTYVRPPL